MKETETHTGKSHPFKVCREWGDERRRKGASTYKVIQETVRVKVRESGVHRVGGFEEFGIGFVSCRSS